MKFAQFRRTKTYDLLTCVPLIFWYGLGIYGQMPNLLAEKLTLAATEENFRAWLHALALVSSFLFLGLLMIFLLLRPPASLHANGLMPRAVAFAHAFLGTGYLWIAPARLSLPAAILSWLLSLGGTVGAIYVAFWLGRAFSITPQARKLVTRGPYAVIRHPLYLAEALGFLGVMMQFRQPWSALLLLATLCLLVLRMGYEERVLSQAYPEYRAYAARTARLIPGIY